jgi:hypothetical protein
MFVETVRKIANAPPQHSGESENQAAL